MSSFTGEAAQWLARRHVVISETKIPKMSQGLSLLNGDLRASLFVRFMRNRADEKFPDLPSELEDMLLKKLEHIREERPFGAIVLLPSRTWMQRESAGTLAGVRLNVPVYSDLLVWKELPVQRQGELLNNDQ